MEFVAGKAYAPSKICECTCCPFVSYVANASVPQQGGWKHSGVSQKCCDRRGFHSMTTSDEIRINTPRLSIVKGAAGGEVANV